MPLINAVARSALASVLLLASCAHAQTGQSSDVVYRLYKGYAWQALLASPEDGGKAVGSPLTAQPRRVLAAYFDATLVRLLLREQDCLAQHAGEVCNLDFDPIFASQDPAATDLQIHSRAPGQVDVQFVYPSNNQTVKLVYRLVRTKAGWRISDIGYPGTKTSLKSLLSQSPR